MRLIRLNEPLLKKFQDLQEVDESLLGYIMQVIQRVPCRQFDDIQEKILIMEERILWEKLWGVNEQIDKLTRMRKVYAQKVQDKKQELEKHREEKKTQQ